MKVELVLWLGAIVGWYSVFVFSCCVFALVYFCGCLRLANGFLRGGC